MDTTLIAISVFLFSLFALAVLGIFLVQKWGKPLFQEVQERSWSLLAADLVVRVETLEADTERLPRTWEEFAVDAKKIHERTRWHIKRVKKELQARGLSDEEIDTLDGTLRPVDGEGSQGSQLQLLPEVVAEIPTGTSAEDWRTKALKRKWSNV